MKEKNVMCGKCGKIHLPSVLCEDVGREDKLIYINYHLSPQKALERFGLAKSEGGHGEYVFEAQYLRERKC